jgi:hypothetical protein
MSELKAVKYYLHEPGYQYPVPREESLLVFIYSIPRFAVCGIFPPLHVANHILMSGGGDGGMGPGTSWSPFELSRDEYNALALAVGQTSISEIEPYARYAKIKMKFDHEFDHLEDVRQWMAAVRVKHLKQWQLDVAPKL